MDNILKKYNFSAVVLVAAALYIIFFNNYSYERLKCIWQENPIADDAFYQAMNSAEYHENVPVSSLDLINKLDLRNKDIRYFSSFSLTAGGDAFTGKVTSPWYSTSAKNIHIDFFGCLTRDTLNIYVEFENGSVIYAPSVDAMNDWYNWTIMNDGTPFRIVVEDNDTGLWGWLAFTEPYASEEAANNILSSVGFILFIFLVFVLFCLFLMPGLAISAKMDKFIDLKGFGSSVPFMFSCLIAYLVFFIAMINIKAGQALIYTITLISVIVIIYFRTEIKKFAEKISLGSHLKLLFVIALFMLLLTNITVTDENVFGSPYSIMNITKLPIDNVLQLYFGNLVLSDLPTTEYLGDWLMSDRPPMGAAVYVWIRSLAFFENDTDMVYQVINVFILSTWSWAVVSLMSFLKCSRKTIGFTLFIMAINNCVVINTVFTWHKMPTLPMYAMLVIAYYKIIDAKEFNTENTFLSVLIGCCAVTSMMFHGTIVIGILGLILALIIKVRTNIKNIIVMLITFIIGYSPWFVYQKFINPPGDRLMKMYFAGTDGLEQNSLVSSIVNAYKTTDMSVILENKLANIKTYLFVGCSRLWDFDFFCLASAIGFMLLLAGMLIQKKTRQDICGDEMRYLARALLFSIILAAILYFDPGQTVIHQSPYSNILLLFVILGALAEYAPYWLKAAIIAGSLVKFALGTLTVFIDYSNMNPIIYVLCCVLSLTMLIALKNERRAVISYE